MLKAIARDPSAASLPIDLATEVTGVLPVANGGTGATALSAVFVGRAGAVLLPLVTNGAVLVAGTFYFTLSSPIGFTISSLLAQCGAGSFTAAVNIGATPVTGLSAVSVTTTPATTAATAARTVVPGNSVNVVVSVPAGDPTDALLQLNFVMT